MRQAITLVVVVLKETPIQNNSSKTIEKILNNFHRVVRQLKIRYNNRQTIEIKDEYDIWDLIHALFQ